MTKALILSLCLLAGCASIKEPTEADINEQALVAYKEVKSKSKVSTNADWTAMLNRVASRIAKASGEKFDWEWTLIDNPEKNAWCMPGGKMAVYTGIMPILKTEAALATVLGHEVAHATKRHGKKGYTRAMKSGIASAVIGTATVIGGQLLCKSESCRMLTGLGGLAAGFAVAFFDRKFSRTDETEADQAGQLYMAKAGYDPKESIKVWERMGAGGQGVAPPEFISTHPADATRRQNLTNWLPQAEELYSQAPQKYGIGEAIK